MQNKKISMRTCIACREAMPKKELNRIVKTKDGEYFYDTTGKCNGRGAYCCGKKTCLEKIINKKLLNHAFETNVPDEFYDKLKEYLV